MSIISSDTLFHFTPTRDRLVSILTNGLYPHYCLEEFHIAGSDGQSRPMFQNAIPMVSFCDTPLSQIKNHIRTYGHYGIGLSKAWGNRKRLNPVLYLTEFAIVSENVDKLIGLIIRTEQDLSLELKAAIVDLVRYIKPYVGSYHRNGQLSENVRFYDEREWRYVPHIGSKIDRLFLRTEEFHNPPLRAQHDQKLQAARLTFEPTDIRYIILREDGEIHPMIRALREMRPKEYNQETLELLTSRIITSEQILRDF